MRSILYDFVKIPQSFFFEKTTAPFTREPLTDNRKGCPYGLSIYFNAILAVRLLLIHDNLRQIWR